MQLVIFDVDGTLVDSQNMIVAAQREAFAACGLEPPSRARSLSIVGLSLAEAFTALVGADGPIEALAEAYKAAFGRLRADPACEEPLFPGAEALIARLAARSDVMLGIATGKSRRGVAHILETHGWTDVFATVQTADDAPSKPDPTMLRQALADTGIQADSAVMIGDTSFDMGMAKAARLHAVGVSWGYHPVAALREAGADTIIDSFEAFDTVLASTAPAQAVA
ncbi:MAG TPA: HAD-IA family hydrolase [Enterovirga sp.]|nr:HAD-IA family hydrolase [Enterovirga sp.]